MNTMDPTTVRLLYEDRLREAERKRRFIYLTLEMPGQFPVDEAKGFVHQIRQWLRARVERRQASDMRRPRVV
ncbi:MAG: hypothetical protein U0703_01665 [Anaerolineae bacterium]